MPTAIGGFIGWLVTSGISVLGAVGFSEAAAIFVIDIGIKLGGLALLGHLAGKLIDIPDLTQTAVSNLVTTRGTLEHQRLIYGEVLASGPLWYMNTAGSHNQSLYHAVMVAGHEVDDITDMWLDEHVIPNAAIDWGGDGSVDSGDFRGNLSEQTTVYFQKKLGSSNQSASTFLASVLGGGFSEITSQHQLRGIAYFVARLDYFENQTQVWSAGVPNNYRALVRGKKVYNPNSDSTTAWGTGPHRLTNSGTWEWSNNPALCWADYMIDNRLGLGENPDKIDYAYVASVSAINSTHVYTPVGSSPRFTCNGILNGGTSHQANLAAILSSANMTMALVQGRWKLRGWEFETPTLQFNDDDVRGDMQIRLSTEESARYNTVRGSFVDKDRQWTAQQFPAFTAAEYVSRDNGEVLYKDIQMPMTTDVYEAQRLAAGVLEQSDLQKVVVYPSNFKTLPVEIGGTIKLSNTKMGWEDEVFRVTNYTMNDMAGIDLILQEDNVAAYTPVGTAEYTVSSQGSYVTANPGVPAPSSLWLVGGGSFIGVNWTTPPARLYETVRVYAARTSSWSDANIVGDVRGASFEHKVDAPTSYWYWVQAANFAGELSNRLPNSDYSAVGGNANPYDAYDNYTFDKSAVNTDFFESTDLSSGWMIVSSAGSNATNGMRIIKSTAAFFQYAGRTFYPLADHQIISDTMKLRVRYKVESTNGYSFPNSAGLYLAAFAWQINTPAPPTYPPKLLPGDRQLVVLDSKFWPVASLATAGTWGYVEATLATSGSWVDGHKLGKPACGISVLSGSSQYFQIIFDDLSFRYT